ncbi:MAG: TonB-dependent receptor [Sediminibacterium magnilacihabitans]|jgi:TonB-linked SusC/RagA family outer membrane protein|nr:TonB-dependent receptor [Sediminibacterium magnilacihabitans]PQV59737.1 TonB-linked SusC/RagA family outer membrane protein [Sediminibacterium magnilacihabitans]
MPTRKKLLARTVMLAILFALLSAGAYAQKSLSGKVTNKANGQPIAGATVQLKGTTTVAVTNAEGVFSIPTKGTSGTLVVSVIGFEPVEQSISGKITFNFALSETISQLNEVLVTGYSVQRKKDITGSVSVVNVRDLKAVPAGSGEQLLQGRASGVNVITSGQPGSGSNIRIRGITSFGNVDPLYIIDGVQGSIRDLNANDIESIQVLKDAGAASIYGVRGSNGVIIVTTKRGKSGKATVTYDAYVGTQRPASGNPFHLLNTQEMATATWAALKNSGQTLTHPQYGSGATPIIPDYILAGGTAGIVGSSPATDPSLYNIDFSKPIYQIVQANKVGTDWFHEIFKPAMIQSHTVSASGGNEKNTYLFSLGYLNQQGTLMNTYLKRYSARVNTTFNIKNNIRVGENLFIYARENPQIGNLSEGNEISMSYREQPIIPVYDIKGGFAGTAAKGLGNAQNPVAMRVRAADNKGYSWDIQGNAYAEVDFLRHLTARTSFGGTLDNFYYYYYGYRSYENAENNGSNSFSENAGYNRSWTWTNTVTYSNVFAEKHNVKALAGIEAVESYGRGVGGGALGFFTDNPNFRTLSNGSSGFTNYSNVYQNSLYSLFGRVDYAYNDKYLLSGTIRRDGSSRFGADKRYGIFPAFSLGWRISRESFLRDVSWISDLKLRGSWGKLGNQLNVNPANAFSLYGGGPGSSYYDINGTSTSSVQGFIATRIGNPKTGWEEDVLTNFGLDAALFKNKLDISFEYYKKSINGLLFTDQAPATVGGATLPVVNIGNIENKGFDFSATYHGTASKDLKFDIGLIVTTYKSNITDIPGQYFEAGGSRIGNFVRNAVGHPIGAFYGYDVVGLFSGADDVSKSATQKFAAPGRFKYRDVNGDGKITADDRTFFGDPNPKFTGGLNLNVSYKDFDLSMFMYGSFGNDVINYVRYWTDFYPSFQGVKSKDMLYGSWTPSNTGAKTPIIENESNFSNNGVVNSYYKEDGSYLRCKSLILGYTIPSTTLKKWGIEKFRIYLQAANLFTITKYTGLDPELSGSNAAFGIDYGNYPNNQKNYNVGVSVTF